MRTWQTSSASRQGYSRLHGGEAIPEGEARQRLVELRALHRHLRDTFVTPDVILAYLRSEIRYLGGMTGREVLLAGRIDRVEGALEALDSGFFI